MSNDFKKKLIRIYDAGAEANGLGKPLPDHELDQMARFGALGELGENYFLYLYRDFDRRTAYYGAVIFLNKRDHLADRPFTVIGVEQNGKEQVRNVYVQAALYFLKNDCQNTLTVTGNAGPVFEMARGKVNTFIGKAVPIALVEELDNFDFDIMDPTIQVRDVPVQEATRKFVSQKLTENLRKLIPAPELNGDGIRDDIEDLPLVRARMGLCLVLRPVDMTGDRHAAFQPMAVPFKTDGSTGKPQKITDQPLTGFQWEKENVNVNVSQPDLLMEFAQRYTEVESVSGSGRIKNRIMNRLYFEAVANKCVNLPAELTFCQWDDQKDYSPLRTMVFKTLTVRVAPSLAKPTSMNFWLTFTAPDGSEIETNTGGRFEVLLNEQNGYFCFTGADEETWFAMPQDPSPFLSFFRFLDLQKEFYSYDFDDVLEALRQVASEHLIIQPEPLKKYELSFLPVPVLKIHPADPRQNKEQRLELEFDYQTRLKEFLLQNPDKKVCLVKTDGVFENRCRVVLKADPMLFLQMDYRKARGTVFHYYYFQGADFVAWLVERGGKYLEKGFRIYSVKWKRDIGNSIEGGSLRINMSKDLDWLEFKPVIHDVQSGDEFEIDIDSIGMAGGMVADKKNRLHMVTKDEIARLERLMQYAERRGPVFRTPSRNHVMIRRLYEDKMDDLPELRQQLAIERKLEKFEKVPQYPVSQHFNGQLREYQQEGFKWLYFLREYGFSGCLADDMGLGKTVQTLALLQTLKNNNKLKTSVLVAPVSAIPNWEAEIGKFTVGLSFHRHLGSGREKSSKGWKVHDLIITSYATLRNDIEIFADFSFDYIILDESQNIKNITSQISKAVKVVRGKNRLALSGTPVENNSMELWSLFDFLMPGYLGTAQWFGRQFARAVEGGKEDGNGRSVELTELLRKMIYPFILRRRKEDVELELPEKIEIVSRLTMDEKQLLAYGETARFYREELEKEIDDKGVPGSSMRIMEGMLRLRQMCLFPRLADEKYTGTPSAKFEHLKELLEEILAEGHKVLIFSQFVQALKIIKSYCDREMIAYSYIDGSVDIATRSAMIEQFQEEGDRQVFLLSLKAGGTALNLTAADYVVIFDPWWNPAVEAQAIDRSHRIGQTKKVMAYRMVVEGTIEEKMLELQNRKKALVENLITPDKATFKNLAKEDILELFS